VGKTPRQPSETFLPDGAGVAVEPWAEGLRIPWSLVFLPGGRALVSERPGTVRQLRDGRLLAAPWATIPVAHEGEGGLLGLALHPRFPSEPYVYVMHTYRKGGVLLNRVVRVRDEGEAGRLDRVVLDGIPGGRYHDGGRIAFGPDGMLYVATGDTFESSLARDRPSLAGKILRVAPDGTVPRDNPFPGSPVWSWGHRNPQGLAFRPGTGELFASEHGPSGEFGRFGHDEVNRIARGRNYGWPDVIGAAADGVHEDPLVLWVKATPPSGIAFCSGRLLPTLANDLFVASLGGKALIRISFSREGETFVPTRIERWFSRGAGDDEGRYGRIRDVVEGPDGALYFLTNNTDGRGTPRPGDDRIWRIVPGR
jgi:quinoprotein glucose dehydrogenase